MDGRMLWVIQLSYCQLSHWKDPLVSSQISILDHLYHLQESRRNDRLMDDGHRWLMYVKRIMLLCLFSILFILLLFFRLCEHCSHSVWIFFNGGFSCIAISACSFSLSAPRLSVCGV